MITFPQSFFFSQVFFGTHIVSIIFPCMFQLLFTNVLYCVRESHIYWTGQAVWFGAGASRSAGMGSTGAENVTGRSVILSEY